MREREREGDKVRERRGKGESNLKNLNYKSRRLASVAELTFAFGRGKLRSLNLAEKWHRVIAREPCTRTSWTPVFVAGI